MKRPCRCLLSEMEDEAELAALVRERAEAVPEEERTPEAEYAERLSRCRGCASLMRGTCRECGCYVEIRAAKKRQKCPKFPAEW